MPDKKHKSSYSRIILLEPGYTITKSSNIQNFRIFDVQVFCENILNAVEDWLVKNEGTVQYKTNYPKFVRRYSTGFPPHIPDVPLIT